MLLLLLFNDIVDYAQAGQMGYTVGLMVRLRSDAKSKNQGMTIRTL